MSANEDEQQYAINIQTEDQLEEHVKEESYYIEKYNLERWEYLYQKDNQLRSKKQEAIKKHKKEINQKIMEECSFQPKLYRNDKYDKYIQNEFNPDTYQRTTQWKDEVDQKVYDLKEQVDK